MNRLAAFVPDMAVAVDTLRSFSLMVLCVGENAKNVNAGEKEIDGRLTVGLIGGNL
jgi:hypothetical protein